LCLTETREYFVFFLTSTSCIKFSLFQNLPLCLNSIWSGCWLLPKLGCDVNLRQYNITQETRTSLGTETSICEFYTIINFRINTTHSQPSHSTYNIITSWHVRLEQNKGFLITNFLITFLPFHFLTKHPVSDPVGHQKSKSAGHSTRHAVIVSVIQPSTLPSQQTNHITPIIYPFRQPVIKLPTIPK
jgi:hypothetical protein